MNKTNVNPFENLLQAEQATKQERAKAICRQIRRKVGGSEEAAMVIAEAARRAYINVLNICAEAFEKSLGNKQIPTVMFVCYSFADGLHIYWDTPVSPEYTYRYNERATYRKWPQGVLFMNLNPFNDGELGGLYEKKEQIDLENWEVMLAFTTALKGYFVRKQGFKSEGSKAKTSWVLQLNPLKIYANSCAQMAARNAYEKIKDLMQKRYNKERRKSHLPETITVEYFPGKDYIRFAGEAMESYEYFNEPALADIPNNLKGTTPFIQALHRHLRDMLIKEGGFEKVTSPRNRYLYIMPCSFK